MDDKYDGLLKEEIKEFLIELKQLPLSKEKKEIERLLKNTKQIFSFQIPTSDINYNGWSLVDQIIDFLIEKTLGFVQADREGFWILRKIRSRIPGNCNGSPGLGIFSLAT